MFPLVARPVILDTTPLASHVRKRLPGAEVIDLTPPAIDPAVLRRVHAIINTSNPPPPHPGGDDSRSE